MKLDKDKIIKIVAAFSIGMIIIFGLSVASGFSALNEAAESNSDDMVEYSTLQEVEDILDMDVVLPDLEYSNYYIEDEDTLVAKYNTTYFKKSKSSIEFDNGYKYEDVQVVDDVEVTLNGDISNPINLASYSTDGYYYLIYSETGLINTSILEFVSIFR